MLLINLASASTPNWEDSVIADWEASQPRFLPSVVHDKSKLAHVKMVQEIRKPATTQ